MQPPALRVSASPAPAALLDFDFRDAPPPWRSGCAWLAGAKRETWLAPAALAVDSVGSVQRRSAGRWAALALSVAVEGDDVIAATSQAYRALLDAVRPSAQPNLIRVWNFVGAINRGDADAERYRRFCIGRDAAVDAMFRDPPPAATAIGAVSADAPLSVVALCSAAPALALENPRQTPAWQYPRQYGPVSPGFSRGAVLRDEDGALLLASGTASIVGHRSLHAGDVLAQLDESLENLGVLLDEGRRAAGEPFALAGLQSLRVYLRNPAALAAVQSRIERAGLPLSQVAFLHGDICRRELDIELEGVFGAA